VHSRNATSRHTRELARGRRAECKRNSTAATKRASQRIKIQVVENANAGETYAVSYFRKCLCLSIPEQSSGFPALTLSSNESDQPENSPRFVDNVFSSRQIIR
jgi:hypothetical protein